VRLLALLLVACGSPPQPDCSRNRLDAIKAEYVRDLVNACGGVPNDQPCPGAVEARARFAAKKAEWTLCPQPTN
jgi:hypothetical protein